jgi:U4/U6.U5 tri-snRNP-associated protein 2
MSAATEIKTSTSPFLFLALDLPPPPLFQDAVEKNIIPQVGIHAVLAKYNGRTTQEMLATAQLRRYACAALPPFVVLHFRRFTRNNFVEEKNPTVVTFPLRGLDLREYVDAPGAGSAVYDLLANVTHESVAGTTRDKAATVWKVHLRAGGGGGDGERWFQVQDLLVEETRKEMIFLGETVLQVGSLADPACRPNSRSDRSGSVDKSHGRERGRDGAVGARQRWPWLKAKWRAAQPQMVRNDTLALSP